MEILQPFGYFASRGTITIYADEVAIREKRCGAWGCEGAPIRLPVGSQKGVTRSLSIVILLCILKEHL